MLRLTLLAILLLSPLSHADILVIGDSHTVGPFGSLLHKNLASHFPDKVIAVYGHSSSAPVHWMSEKPYTLSGGISHHVSYKETYLEKTPDWRIKQPTLNFLALLDNPIHHPDWRSALQVTPEIDTVIIELGANDRPVIANEYQKRVKILDAMITEITGRGMKCIWIGPPTSSKGNPARDELTQKYLLEGINGRCPFFDSRKFVATACDQVHFSCPAGLPVAKAWVKEAFTFILNNL